MRGSFETIFQKDSAKSGAQFTPMQELQAARGQLSYFQWCFLIKLIKIMLSGRMGAL